MQSGGDNGAAQSEAGVAPLGPAGPGPPGPRYDKEVPDMQQSRPERAAGLQLFAHICPRPGGSVGVRTAHAEVF